MFKNMKEKYAKNTLVFNIIIALVLVGVSYYIGYQKGAGSNSSQYAAGNGGGMRAGGANRGNGLINGSVIAKDDTSITVQGRDGSSKIVLYSPTSQVMKSTSGSISDVVIGSQIMVQGKANSDGSVVAQTIQIRPNMPKTASTTTQ